MAFADPQETGKVTPSNPTPSPLQTEIAASNAANPQAAGANGSLFTYSGATPMPPQSAPSTGWASDPIYQLALGQNELAIKNAQAAALTSQIQALIAYGDPNLALAVTGDQNVANAAAANRGSTLARLVATNASNVRDTNESENQNNLFYSSDRGYKQGLNQQAYLNSSSDALSNVQGQLGSIGANLLAQEQGAYANEAQAANDAYNRAVANPVGSPSSTPPPAAKTNASGGPVPPVANGTPAPKNSTFPYATSILANKTGGSANKTQGLFSIH